MSRYLIAIITGIVLVLTGCGRSVSAPPAVAGYRLILDEGFGGASEHLTIRESGSGAIERELPIGTPAPDWSRYYVVTALTGSTRLAALDPLSGRTLAQTTIPSGYALPQLGFGGPTAGLSPNGAWLALTGQGRSSSGQTVTSFLIGPTSLSEPFTEIHVIGQFDFDALSNDGRNLYLIEPLKDPGHYHVRLYDVAGKTLLDQVVVDKNEPKEAMAGLRGDSVAQPAGSYVYTIYARQNDGPFIHALPLDESLAFCLDLPGDPINDVEEEFLWSLAITPDGSTLYAVNGSLGHVAVITSTSGFPQIARTGSLALKPASSSILAGLVVNAEAKGARIGGAALSPDGRRLYAVADSGLVAIDTTTLKVRARLLEGDTIVSIRLSSDGKWLYVADTSTGRVVQLDPKTGAVAGQIANVPNVWAILWAQR
jgi:hypothetical protein